MPGTKLKNNTIEYSDKCQKADFRLLSAVIAQMRDVPGYECRAGFREEETFGGAEGPFHQVAASGKAV